MNMAKAFDKKLYSGLRRDLRKVGTDAAESSRAEVRKAPMREVTRTVSEGRFHKRTRSGLEESTRRRRSRRHALRAAIAQGIKVQISNSPSARRVGVFVVSKGSDPASKVLKRRWDQPKGWRHPVFPDPKIPRDQWTWTGQHGRPGYFSNTMEGKRPIFTAAVKDALEKAAAAAAVTK
jgi:hypothetical protein